MSEQQPPASEMVHDATHYNMNHAERGMALIFNHKHYKNDYQKKRRSTDEDCEKLGKSLKTLGFTVVICQNFTAAKIKSKLVEVAGLDHKNHDCLVVSIMTHGILGKLYAWDESYDIMEIFSPFSAENCKSLKGKPKIFFIQACQGRRMDPGYSLPLKGEPSNVGVKTAHTPSQECFSINQSSIEDVHVFEPEHHENYSSSMTGSIRIDDDSTETFDLPMYPDFLIAQATIPGYVAWRFFEKGSWFVLGLCSELNQNGTKEDLLTLLTHVAYHVATRYESSDEHDHTKCDKKQITCTTSTLMHVVKFSPPKKEGTIITINNKEAT